jgi:hypothetical protein
VQENTAFRATENIDKLAQVAGVLIASQQGQLKIILLDPHIHRGLNKLDTDK